MYSIKNETRYSLLVEIDWKQSELKPKEQIRIKPQSTRLVYFEDGIDVPLPEEVFKELRLKVVQDDAIDNFCVFNEENEPTWEARYDLFDIYYSLDVRKSDGQYLKNSKLTSIGLPC